MVSSGESPLRLDARGRSIEWPTSACLKVGGKAFTVPLSPTSPAFMPPEVVAAMNDARERLVCCRVEDDVTVVLGLPGGGEKQTAGKIFGSRVSSVQGVPFSGFAVKVRRIESENVEDDIASAHHVHKLLGDARMYLVPALDVVPDMFTIMLRATGTASDACGQRECYSALFAFTIAACTDLAARGLEARDWKPDNLGYVDLNGHTCRWYILDTAQIMSIEACPTFAATTLPLNANYRDGTIQACGEAYNGLAATAWASLATMLSTVLGRTTEKQFWHTREDLYGDNVDAGDPRLYGEHPLHDILQAQIAGRIGENGALPELVFLKKCLRRFRLSFKPGGAPRTCAIAMQDARAYWKHVHQYFQESYPNGPRGRKRQRSNTV